MMRTHYKLLRRPAAQLLKQLYEQLVTAASGAKSTLYHLEDAVIAFFRQLFPLVYHHELHPKMKTMNSEFSECLQENLHEIRPFGEESRHLASRLSRSFETPLSVIESISLVIEVLNATNQYEYHSECYTALTRMTQCSMCGGHIGVRPCNGLCMNVARGCLAGLLDLDQPWNQLTAALERIASNTHRGISFEENIAGIGNQISEGIMYFMVNGLQIDKRVSLIFNKLFIYLPKK